MFGEELVPDTPVVRYAAVSSIEHGHKSMVSHVEWVPDHFEVRRSMCGVVHGGVSGYVLVGKQRSFWKAQ